MSRSKVWLAIDIGGTKVLCALFSEGGQIKAEKQIPVPSKDGTVPVEGIVRAVEGFVTDTLEDGYLNGIGIAAPGAVVKGTVRVAANLNWHNVDLLGAFQQVWPIPVTVENDCAAAAIGEATVFAREKNFVYLAVGTGIGAGIIVGGTLYKGNGGRAGEVGHMLLDPNGPYCRCGSQGCFEALASGKSLETRARHFYDGPEPVPTASEILSSDASWARFLVDEWLEWLAIGCVSLIRCLAPKVLLFGGGVGSRLAPLFPELKKRIHQLAPALISDEVCLEVAHFGERSALIGASVLARRNSSAGGERT